jgi:hypothetical protein
MMPNDRDNGYEHRFIEHHKRVLRMDLDPNKEMQAHEAFYRSECDRGSANACEDLRKALLEHAEIRGYPSAGPDYPPPSYNPYESLADEWRRRTDRLVGE